MYEQFSKKVVNKIVFSFVIVVTFGLYPWLACPYVRSSNKNLAPFASVQQSISVQHHQPFAKSPLAPEDTSLFKTLPDFTYTSGGLYKSISVCLIT